jgi:chloride channel protein, CIC family
LKRRIANALWKRTPFGIFRDPDLGGSGRWIVLSALIGAVSGVGAILFDLAFRASQWALLESIGRFRPPAPGAEGGAGFPPQNVWLLPLSLVIGALIAGAIVFGFAPEAEGHGTDAVIDAFHRKRGKIRRRIPFVKAIASAITIGSGGSAGREGPIAQIGAGFGSALGDLLRLTNSDRRILMMAGVAGGIGGIFKAPLGATLFAAEVLYSSTDFEYEVLVPGLISAITSYSIYSSYAGWGFLFDVPQIAFHRPRELGFYALLGLVCAFVGWLYPRVFYGIRDYVFRPMPLPRWIKPAVGALALGLLAVFFPQALGMGYGYIQEAIRGEHTAAFLLTFALVKMLATSLTISSGGSGGVFGPSLVIGGALGAAFGKVASDHFPGLSPEPVAALMVGMGGFFAGVAKVPFASVIMVMEMTGSYGLLVPSLLVATMAYLFLPRGTKLYENQVASRLDSPVHEGSFATEVLQRGRLGDTWDPRQAPPRTVRGDAALPDLVQLASESPQAVFPVVDDRGSLLGEISVEDVRRALLAEGEGPTPHAADIMREVPEPLLLEHDLAHVARKLAAHHAEAMTVVQASADRTVVGVFGRRDLIVAYGRLLQRLHAAAESETATGVAPK